MGTGERGEIVAVNRGLAGMAWHSELGGARAVHRKRGGSGSYSQPTLKIGTWQRRQARTGLMPYTVAVQ